MTERIRRLKATTKALDKAAKHGTIHWKAAARKKSRLAAEAKRLAAAAK